MSLVVPVEFLPIKQNGQFCADGAGDFDLVSMTGAIQVIGVPQVPGARIPSFTGLPASRHLSATQRVGHQSADVLSFSKTAVQQNVRSIQTSSSSAPKYIGLPYQDHNYVQLPPSTPPLSPSSSSSSPGVPTAAVVPAATVPKSNLSIDDISYHMTVTTAPDDSVTRCICEFQHDDGYMIQCDKCGVWQHVDCMEVDRDNIPDSYMCELCEPRKVDKHKAIRIQTNKRDTLSMLRVDSSATETEDETTDGRRRSFDKSPAKKEPKEVGAGTLALSKRRKSRSKRDERLKRKLLIKRQSNGQQKLSILTPKKPHLAPTLTDGFGENMRQDASLPRNGTLVVPASPSNPNPATGVIYQEAVSNQYTVELQNLLASIKFNGQQGPVCSPSVYEKLNFGPQSCLPAAVSSTRMCLEACEDILTNQPLTEYVGNVMLRDQYDRDGLFYFRSAPDVLFYSKLGGLELCIDAGFYGNNARYVRRSCTPNAEVRHLLEGSAVRFFICATKSIVRGAEITIPFDFNYHKCCFPVDCSCTRVSCPVARFQRREVSHTSGPLSKRQRSARSLDVISTKQENATSPRKLPSSALFPSPLALSFFGAEKHMKMPPFGSFKAEPKTEIEIDKTEIKTEPDPVKLEPLSPPTWLSPSTPVRAVSHETSFPASVMVTSSSAVNASDAEENDKSKKKTREEKKLEAVMKMFERIEKQQERKKEAQSRHEHGRGKEVTKVRESRKSKDKSENKNIAEMTYDAVQPSPGVTSNCSEQVTITLPESTELKPRVKRSKQTAASRRASMGSAAAAHAAASHHVDGFNHPPVTLFGSSDGLRPTGVELSVSSAENAADSAVSSVYLSNASALETATSLLALSAERWTGYPKKLMMKGQDLHRQLTIRTEGLDTNSNSEGDSGKEFLQRVPSPHSCSLKALRRNSMPAFGNGAAGDNGKATLFAAASAGNGTDSKGCSAKKRWLQQAMCDKTELQSIGEEITSGNGQMSTNSYSPTDFVTPLKKRRLARESLCTEDPPSATLQQEDSTFTSTVYPLYESISDDDHVDVEMTPKDVANERVGMWDASLISHQTDITNSQKVEKIVLGSGLLRTQVPAPMGVRPSMIHHPEAFLLMPVGYPAGDNRSVGSTIPSVSSGFGAGIGVNLASIQAWQKAIPDLVTSGVGSGLVVANPYYTAGYLSNLVPAVQKQDSLNLAGRMNYRLAFSNIESACNISRNSSASQAAPLAVGFGSAAGIGNAVYLTTQIPRPAVNPEVTSSVGVGYPMSLFSAVTAQGCDVQGIMALAEAACRSREKAAETRAQAGRQLQVPARNRSEEGGVDSGEMSSNVLYTFPLASGDHHAKRQGSYFNTKQTSFISGMQNSGLNRILPLHGDTVLTSNSSDLPVNGANVSHSAPLENGTSPTAHCIGASVYTGSNGSAISCNATGYATGLSMSPAASPVLLSQSSTAGQCTSKKKVSLHEYKMRCKSGGQSQGRLSSGSGSAPDSDASLSQSFDAAGSSLNRSTSESPDDSRGLSDGLSLAWSSDATGAEKALDNLTSGEKLFRIDKGNVIDFGSSSSSCKLLNRTFLLSESVAVQPASSATARPAGGISPPGVLPGNIILQLRESQSNQQHAGAYGTSGHSLIVGRGVATPLSTSAGTGNGLAAANDQGVQTSNFTGEPPGNPLIQC